MTTTVWTIKVDKKMDAIVEKLVRELGYTSKAEFIREAVREAIIRKYIGLLGLFSMDRLQSSKGDPMKALEKLSRLGIDRSIIEKELEMGKKDVEKLITE
ncbi:MAG: ribbon-helix-helix domain-containing protein [Candidatus Njordarchaeales archaeon]